MIPAFQSFNFGGGVNPFMSRVATYFMRDHLEAARQAADRHLPRQARRDAAGPLRRCSTAPTSTISKPEGGFFIWIKLPTGTDTKKLAELAAEASVAVRARARRSMPNGGGEEFIRLAYSYESPEKCYEGAK